MTNIEGPIQQRRGTEAAADSWGGTMLAGELGYETDSGLVKVGDGSTAWASLLGISGMMPWGVMCIQSEGRSVAVDNSGRIVSNLATSAANNVTVIQAAIDHLEGTYTPGSTTDVGYGGGGTVFLGAHLWRIDQYLDLKYGVSLKGAGCSFDRNGFVETAHSMQGTVLHLEGSAPSVDIDDGASTVNVVPAILCGRLTSGSSQSTTNPHGSTISDLGIWMRDNNTGTGIQLADTQFMWIERVVVTGANGSGGRGIEVRSSNSPDDGGHATHVYRSWINYCDVGLEARGSGSTDGMIEGCRFLQCESSSVILGANSGGGGWQVRGCHFTSGASDQTTEGTDAHLVLKAGPQVVTGNYFDTNGGNDILVDTALACIVGNYFKGGSGGANARIRLEGNGRKSVVVGNTAQAGGGDEGFVEVNATTTEAYRPVVTGNILGDGGNAPNGVLVNDAGTHQSEDNSSMSTSEGTGTDPYYYGNRMVESSV